MTTQSQRGPPGGGQEREWSETGADEPDDPEGVCVPGQAVVADPCRRQVPAMFDGLLDGLHRSSSLKVSDPL